MSNDLHTVAEAVVVVVVVDVYRPTVENGD